MAQDVGMVVLWCHSHLVWLVFEASIPTFACTCFHERKVSVTCTYLRSRAGDPGNEARYQQCYIVRIGTGMRD